MSLRGAGRERAYAGTPMITLDALNIAVAA
jgi:hypothetical protein